MTGQLTITVETVTPIFLGGAKARELAETIRPASIRGQVRYWLRALLGATIDPADPEAVEKLKTREGELMGDTEAGSPVRFRVRTIRPLQYIEKRADGRRMLPHRRANPQDKRSPLPEAAFLENQQFEIILSPRPGLSKIPDEVVATTLLWLHLGGLGKRSRRGFGSLQPVTCSASEGVVSSAAREKLPVDKMADAQALRDRIDVLLTWAGGLSRLPAHTWVDSSSAYPILHKDVAGVRVSDAVTAYNLTDYHQAMVPFWVESLRNQDKGLKDGGAYGYANGGRRASPFHLHIARSSQGYHQVITTFWSDPAPNGATGWQKVAALLADVEHTFGALNLWGKAS